MDMKCKPINGWTKAKIKQHIREQFKGKSTLSQVEWRLSNGDTALCRYRGPEGKKCVVGLFIPEDVYSSNMENKGALALLHSFPILGQYMPLPEGYMSDFQGVHDSLEDNATVEQQLADLLEFVDERVVDDSVIGHGSTTTARKASKPRKRSKARRVDLPFYSGNVTIPISHEVPEDHPEQRGSLTLALGKRYYRRDGGITGRLENVLTEPLYDFYDPEYAELYTSKARGYVAGSTGHHKADLVSECKAEVVDKGRRPQRLVSDVLEWPSDVKVIECGTSELSSLLIECIAELNGAMTKFPSFNSLHEAMSVLREEVDELWEEVRKKQVVNGAANLARTAGARKEAVQVIAMAMRLVLDNCTEGKLGYGK